MGRETSANSPKPSSTLTITMISAMVLQADDVYLVVSLSGDDSYLVVTLSGDKRYLDVFLAGDENNQKRHIPVHKDGETNPWLGLTFFFPVDEAVAPSCCLQLKIKKAKGTLRSEDVGEVDVPVRDLLGKGSAGNMKPNVLSCKVKSSSGETKGHLRFCYALVPLPDKKAVGPVASDRAAPVPEAAPLPSGYPWGYLPEAYPPAYPWGYPPGAYPPANPWGYPPGAYPPANPWGYPPGAYPVPPANPSVYPPAAAYPPAHPSVYPPVAYSQGANLQGNFPQAPGVYPPNASNYVYPSPAGCPGAPIPGPAPYPEVAYPPTAALPLPAGAIMTSLFNGVAMLSNLSNLLNLVDGSFSLDA